MEGRGRSQPSCCMTRGADPGTRIVVADHLDAIRDAGCGPDHPTAVMSLRTTLSEWINAGAWSFRVSLPLTDVIIQLRKQLEAHAATLPGKLDAACVFWGW
ncbi:hypothetical protein ACLOJK_001369 [Asimina triloba]